MVDLLLFSFCAGGSLVLFFAVISAVRHGKVGVDGASAPYSWQASPGKFALIVFCYLLAGGGLSVGAVSIGLRMLERM